MKRLYLFSAFIAILFLLPACDTDSTEPDEPQAKLKLELKLKRHGSSYESSIEGEVVSSMEYNMNEIQQLIYLIHDAENGRFLSFFTISKNDLEPVTAEGITTIEDGLPFGKYYLTIIATTEEFFFNSTALAPLAANYEKAFFRIPNSRLFYATKQIDCRPGEGISPEEQLKVYETMELDLLTGEFIFLLPKGSKGIPTDANFNIAIEVADLPCAFFLKNGRTLKSSEEKELQAQRYNDSFEITERFEKQLTATYHYLNNMDLEDSKEGRGYFQLVYKEDAESSLITNQLNIVFPECSVDPGPPVTTYTHTYMYDLYSGKPELF